MITELDQAVFSEALRTYCRPGIRNQLRKMAEGKPIGPPGNTRHRHKARRNKKINGRPK